MSVASSSQRVMRAAVLREPGTDLTIEQVTIEEPGADEVLLRIAAAGVCHSDLSVVRGEFATPLPAVLGHEGAGIVESVGANVTHVAPGDHALILFRAACGSCRMCRIGRPALCDQGARLRRDGVLVDGRPRYSLAGEPVHHFSGASTFAELAVVPAAAVIAVPKKFPLSSLAVVGCAVLTGTGAALNAAQVQPGSVAVVIGCGGVGLSAVQGCSIAGAAAVVAVDLNERRLELAAELGATHTVCSPAQDARVEVEKLTEGMGADYALETAGTTRTLALALELIRPGGTAVAVGVPPLGSQLTLELPPFVVTEKVLKGCFYGTSNFARDVPLLLALYESGRLDLDAMIGREVELGDINAALDALERDALARTIIRMEGNT
jgi:Zn-dependent alcohol dehydrogenase